MSRQAIDRARGWSAVRLVQTGSAVELVLHVIGCPPRLAYMRGWDVDQLLAHVAGRGWRLHA